MNSENICECVKYLSKTKQILSIDIIWNYYSYLKYLVEHLVFDKNKLYECITLVQLSKCKSKLVNVVI